MANKVLYRLRKFLNAGKTMGGLAAIKARVAVDQWEHFNSKTKKLSKSIHTDNELSISDCNRVISLDIDFTTNHTFKNTIKKLQLLQTTLHHIEFAIKQQKKQMDLYKSGHKSNLSKRGTI